MREIKFRGWSIARGDWVYGSLTYRISDTGEMYNSHICSFYENTS